MKNEFSAHDIDCPLDLEGCSHSIAKNATIDVPNGMIIAESPYEAAIMAGIEYSLTGQVITRKKLGDLMAKYNGWGPDLFFSAFPL